MDLEKELEKIIGLTGGELTLRVHDVAGRVEKIKHLIETREGEIKKEILKLLKKQFEYGNISHRVSGALRVGIKEIFGR